MYICITCVYIYIYGTPPKKTYLLLLLLVFTEFSAIFLEIFLRHILRKFWQWFQEGVPIYLLIYSFIQSINLSIYRSIYLSISIYINIYKYIYIYYIYYIYIYVYTYNSGYHRYRQTCETWRFWDQEVLVPPPFKLCLKYNIHWGIFVFWGKTNFYLQKTTHSQKTKGLKENQETKTFDFSQGFCAFFFFIPD